MPRNSFASLLKQSFLLELIFIILFSALFACSFNALKPAPTPWFGQTVKRDAGKSTNEKVKGEASTSEVQAWLEAKEPLFFLDARTEEEWRSGHLPGAMLFPIEALYGNTEAHLEALPKDRRIIIYCNDSNCDRAHILYDNLVRAGIKNVFVMPEGFNVWVNGGGLVETEK